MHVSSVDGLCGGVRMTPTHAGTNMDFQPTGYSRQTNPLPELKPCPFCGCTDVRIVDDYWIDEMTIICPNCRLLISEDDSLTKEDMIRLWNRRVKE